MIEREYKIKTISNKFKYYVVEFKDEKYRFLTEFFTSDGNNIGLDLIEKICEIQSQAITDYEILGNAYLVLLSSNGAKVFDYYVDENKYYSISLENLKELTLEWLRYNHMID